ncbi:unnamed protein product [Rhodiola kirilowii]
MSSYEQRKESFNRSYQSICTGGDSGRPASDLEDVRVCFACSGGWRISADEDVLLENVLADVLGSLGFFFVGEFFQVMAVLDLVVMLDQMVRDWRKQVGKLQC